jgi:hypothetical protein
MQPSARAPNAAIEINRSEIDGSISKKLTIMGEDYGNKY